MSSDGWACRPAAHEGSLLWMLKLDWEIWTASLAGPEQWRDLMGRLVQWIDTSTSRVPTTDYYDAEGGRQIAFQARSVVGGVFVKALMNPEAAHTWSRKR